MRGRRGAAARLVLVHAYEGAVAIAYIAAGIAAAQGVESAAAQRVLPEWAVRPAQGLLCLAGLLTLGGLIATAVIGDEVRQVLASRCEQVGQWLAAGVVLAIAVGVFAVGAPGFVTGAVYVALAGAAVARAAKIGRDFTRAEHEQGEQ